MQDIPRMGTAQHTVRHFQNDRHEADQMLQQQLYFGTKQ